MSRFLRPHLAHAQEYVPGEQWTGAIVKLNTNESPYDPSPRVAEAVARVAGRLMRYPPADAKDAREAFARKFNLPPEMIFVSNGSDEILRIAFQAYIAPDDRVAWSTPTYTLYEVLAHFAAARVIDVPRDDDFRIPVKQLGSVGAKLTIIANPNSPTGTVTPTEDIETLASFGGLIVIDEAYADFAGVTAIDLTRKFDNIIVIRTLSKSYALAGLRVGFAVAHPDIIADFMRLKDSYNVSVMANAGAAAALEDEDHARMIRGKTIATRDRVSARLGEIGFRVYPSGTNFLFMIPPDKNGKRLYENLRDRGILVRWFESVPRISEGIRVTIGTDGEMDKFMEAVAK